MELVERWLLLLYLPLLAPLVVLTFFTWPWKVIGHAFRGVAMSIRATWRGYSRSRHSHRRRPFSLWRNMFLGCWLELAKQQESKHGRMSAAGYELAPAYLDTLLEATKETQSRICSGLRASMLTHSIFAAFLLLALMSPMHAAGSSSQHHNSVAVDLSGMFAGLAFILSLAIVGVYVQLTSLLSAAGTPEQFYWFICSWERAMAGGQLATATIITLSFASCLAAAFELFSDWVFIVLLFAAATLLYGYMYFWSDSMWCPYNGAYVHYSQSFHRDFLGRDSLQAHPSCCAFWELEPVLTQDARGSIYDRLDRYLWRESQVSWYVGSTGGAIIGRDSMTGGAEVLKPARSTQHHKAGGRTSPAPAAAPARATAAGPSAAAAEAGGAAAASAGAGPSTAAAKPAQADSLYSSWPSLMRYTSGSSSKMQGRSRHGSGSGSGLQVVTEGAPGAARGQSVANLPA